MNRRKLFVENVFAYGFIGVLNKIVPFLLLPLITRMLSNPSDFGIYSMYTTLVGFGTPFALLGIYDAMFREYFEKDDIEYKYSVTTTAQRIIIISASVVCFLLIMLSKEISYIFFGDISHYNIVILAGVGVFLGAIMNPIQAPTRMQNQRSVFIVSGLISSLVTYVLALILIYIGFSYYGLIYSSITATFVLLIFFWIRNNSFFLNGKYNKKVAIELFRIGIPLIPTFLIYWVYNSLDKIMIANMLGTSELGIYSIGAKMGQVSQLIYAGFAGGWQYFSFSTMKDKDQVELNSKIFEYLGAISILSLVIIYPFIPLIFDLLFEGDYIKGYTVSPYLYLSPLLLMLFQVVANQFLVIKKSYYATISLTFGALINVILNFVLIKYIGIEGAAIATLIGYIVTLITVIIVSSRLECMNYSNKVIAILLTIPFYFVVQRCMFPEMLFFQFVFMILLSISIIILYKNEVVEIVRRKRGKRVNE